MFGREFPFEQLLVLWDTIFAYDPTLELIDLVCVSMLIRIRWTCKSYLLLLYVFITFPKPCTGAHKQQYSRPTTPTLYNYSSNIQRPNHHMGRTPS